MTEELGFYRISYIGTRMAYLGGNYPSHFYKIDVYDNNGALVTSSEKEAGKAVGYTDCLDDLGYRALPLGR